VRGIHYRAWLLSLFSAALQVLIWLRAFPLLLASTPLFGAVLRARLLNPCNVISRARVLPAARPGRDFCWVRVRNHLVLRKPLLDLRYDAPVWRVKHREWSAFLLLAGLALRAWVGTVGCLERALLGGELERFGRRMGA